MHRTFYNAGLFDSDLSSWDISNVTNFNQTFDNTNLSQEHQCAIHTSWSSNENWPYDWSEFCVNDVELTVDYLSGWNLVGLPLLVEDSYYLTLFPDAYQNTLYGYSGGYLMQTELSEGEGYWLNFSTEGSEILTGNTIQHVVISLSAGWNLISGISNPIDINNIQDPDEIIINGTLYGFNNIYESTTIIQPGKGYWVNSIQDGEVTLTSGATAKSISNDYKLNGKANTLNVNGSELYFGLELSDTERLSYSLPPKPPAGAFDVRFKNGWRLVKDYGVVELMPTTETLTISYDIQIPAGQKKYWAIIQENGEEIILENMGEVEVPSTDRFTLERKEVIPDAFSLHQNFPNPFNPITTLSYELPKESVVRLTVYDMLGHEVITLVDAKQKAGYKSIRWNATDRMGIPVSAGVYIYQLHTEDYSQFRKMILLK
jgi:hypothetical protein